MDNKVVYLNYRNFKETVQKNFGKPILMAFSNRKTSSLLYRTLANKYHEKIIFAQINSNDRLSDKFEVDDFPSIMVLTDSVNFKGEKFEGKINKKNLLKFFNKKILSKNFKMGGNIV